jgi:Chaperone of endosialidase
MKTTTLPLKHSMNLSSVRLALLLVPLALVCFALSPQARATCQEGCLTNLNTSLGEDALLNNTGSANTAVGFDALVSNTTGESNTATGAATLVFNTTGVSNTAIGFDALYSNTTGSANTATGDDTLVFNTTGSYNTAIGTNVLYSNTTGSANTVIGAFALLSNTIGYDNTATGYDALNSNSTGFRNTANGLSALAANTSGSQNTADGVNSLFKNTTGAANVAIGYNALFNNTTGGFNTAIGPAAGSQLTTGSNNIDIANKGIAAEVNTIRIGTTGTQANTYIAGISGVTVAGGVGVITDSSGHLGTVVSSARFKDAVKPMDKASEAILALKPVTFHYKHDLDPEGIPQFGLVAEDVEKVNPALVARDEQGKPYTVRYDAVNAMLLNEFLKARRQIDAQQRQIEALTAGLQKVSAQLEGSKLGSQMVSNNP